MNLVVLFLLGITFYRSKFVLKDYNKNIFPKKQTKSISGIFVILVFVRHFFQYVDAQSYDKVLAYIDSYTQQLIVVPFLFFSGYALMLNLKSNREKYLQKLLKKIFLLWIHFVLGVFLFIFLNYLLGEEYLFPDIALSFLGMASVGNSTWYIVAIIFLWSFTYVSFKIFKNELVSFLALAILMILYALVFDYIKGEIWYNTIIAYYLGMVFYKIKYYFDDMFLDKPIVFWSLLVVSVLVVIFQSGKELYLFELRVVFFCLFIVLFSYKVKIDNKVLRFLGKYVFEIYLLQRLSMMALKNVFRCNLIYFGICFLITILCAVLFKRMTDFIDKKIDYL